MHFILTFDGDWDSYFTTSLPNEKRVPDPDALARLLKRELAAARAAGGKCVHFVHTSPLVRDFFLRPEFMQIWRSLEAAGGETGVHCHEEELYSAWYYDDIGRMKPAITALADGLRAAGLTVCAYRGGFMAFSPKLIPLLEQQNLTLDFSCDSGRHLVINGQLVSDWQGAPDNIYRMDYEDHRRAGHSGVCEIPLGIYIEKQSLFSIWRACHRLRTKQRTAVVSVLAHTYDFSSFAMRLKIWCALMICRVYGKFIGTAEALAIIKELKL